MAHETSKRKGNVTVNLSADTIRKGKVLAAQIESLVGADAAYERSERAALAILDKGFHLGGLISASREELHEW